MFRVKTSFLVLRTSGYASTCDEHDLGVGRCSWSGSQPRQIPSTTESIKNVARYGRGTPTEMVFQRKQPVQIILEYSHVNDISKYFPFRPVKERSLSGIRKYNVTIGDEPRKCSVKDEDGHMTQNASVRSLENRWQHGSCTQKNTPDQLRLSVRKHDPKHSESKKDFTQQIQQ